MARKKVQSPLRQEYMKQRRRIQQFVRRAEKRGYIFEENVIPDIKVKRVTKNTLSRIAKMTPKSLYEKATYVSDKSYGEILTGTEGRSLERSISAQKGVETRKQNRMPVQTPAPQTETTEPIDTEMVYTYNQVEELPSINYTATNETDFEIPQQSFSFETFYERMIDERYRKKLMEYNKYASEMLLNWYLAVRDRMGIKTTAKMLELAQQEGILLERKDTYDQAKVQEYIGKMMDILPEAGDFTKDQIMDALEYEESYEEPL